MFIYFNIVCQNFDGVPSILVCNALLFGFGTITMCVMTRLIYRSAEELEDWVNTINLVTAAMSSEPLAAGVGSQKKFHRPLLPSAHTRLPLVISLHLLNVCLYVRV